MRLLCDPMKFYRVLSVPMHSYAILWLLYPPSMHCLRPFFVKHRPLSSRNPAIVAQRRRKSGNERKEIRPRIEHRSNTDRIRVPAVFHPWLWTLWRSCTVGAIKPPGVSRETTQSAHKTSDSQVFPIDSQAVPICSQICPFTSQAIPKCFPNRSQSFV